MAKNAVKAMALLSRDSALFNNTYQAMTPAAGLTNAVFLLRIINDSNQDITVSYDGGVTDHEFVPSASSVQFPFQSNALPPSFVAILSKGTHIYVKGAAAGVGTVYVSGYYLDEI